MSHVQMTSTCDSLVVYQFINVFSTQLLFIAFITYSVTGLLVHIVKFEKKSKVIL